MSRIGGILCLVTLFSLSLANSESVEEETKFSKLLNKKSDLFRYTSILNSPKPASEFHRVYSKDEESAFANRQGLSEPRVITRPEPGEEFVRIHQSIRNSNEKNNEKSIEDQGSVTNINQKPIYGRTPVALLRQGSGNRLNISPVFPNQWEPVNRIARFDNSSEENPQGEVTTVSPNYDESSEGTTANYEDTEETPDPTEPTVRNEVPQKKMVVNVVTSAPRVVFDNVTAIRRLPTKPDSDNFVLDSRRRQTQFPDFEDTPVNLAVAESHQPARVNVRPANSGNAYEYEYIYYYYDDEDDDNSTTGKTEEKDKTATQSLTVDSPIQTLSNGQQQQVEPQTQAFVNIPSSAIPDTESIQQLDLSKDYVDPSKYIVENPREEKAFIPLNMEDEEIPAAIEDIPIQTTVQPEIFTKRPFGNKPFVIKQSNLPQQEAPAISQPVPTTRATTTTLRYVEPDVTTSRLGQRFRQKTRNEFQQVTQNQLPLSPEPTSPSVTLDTTRRNPFKDSNRLRNQGSRRVPQALEPEVEQNRVASSPTFETAPSIKSEVVEEEVRFPARTRFPPRTHATATTPLLTSPYVSLEPASTVITPTTIDPAVDKKAKENFARQKSINDLYALTRLHQLAINSRVPNRKIIDAKAKASSAEATTKYPDDASSSESATISATTSTNQLNQVNVEISRIPVTTQDISSAAPTSAIPSPTTTEYAKFGRGRPGRRRPSPAPTTTTEGAPSSRITHPNRFGRRRSTSTTPTPEAFQSDAPVSPVSSPAAHEEESTPGRRNPARSRFATRNRFTSSTTTEANGEESDRPASLASSVAPSEQPQRRRPNNFPRRRFNNQQVNPSVSASTDEAVASPSPYPQTEAPTRPTATSEDRHDRRKFNFARSRPSIAPATGPQIISNRQRVRFQSSTTTSEAPQPQVEEIDGPEASPTLQTEQIEKVEAPVATSFSQTSSVVEQPTLKGRGSAGVLGRLRNRAKVTPSTTTAAPESSVADKKPSRLTGILNRRKVTPATSAPSHAPEEVEESHNNGGEQDDVQRKEVIIQVSSTVTESEEVGEAVDAPSSTTTHTSILSRLKSQRKPGSIFSRKKPENPSE